MTYFFLCSHCIIGLGLPCNGVSPQAGHMLSARTIGTHPERFRDWDGFENLRQATELTTVGYLTCADAITGYCLLLLMFVMIATSACRSRYLNWPTERVSLADPNRRVLQMFFVVRQVSFRSLLDHPSTLLPQVFLFVPSLRDLNGWLNTCFLTAGTESSTQNFLSSQSSSHRFS